MDEGEQSDQNGQSNQAIDGLLVERQLRAFERLREQLLPDYDQRLKSNPILHNSNGKFHQIFHSKGSLCD